MSTSVKTLLETAARPHQTNPDRSGSTFFRPGGVETLEFEDPSDINAGGTATIYGNSGVVRLELSLPADRAAEVIEYVVSGRRLGVPPQKRTSLPEPKESWTDRMNSDSVSSQELADLIAEQDRDAAGEES